MLRDALAVLLGLIARLFNLIVGTIAVVLAVVLAIFILLVPAAAMLTLFVS